jgi:hypothetical protein
MKYLFLLLLISGVPSLAQSSMPNFTTGTMTQTTTSTQTITETSQSQMYGGEVQSWNGNNVKAIDGDGVAGADITATGIEFEIVDNTLPWQVEVITRAAGVVEVIDTTRNIQTDSVTDTLSVFSR